MRVIRGHTDSIDEDRNVVQGMREFVDTNDTEVVRVWCPPRQVSFGPRDIRHEGFERAASIARSHGFPPSKRTVGGRAVAYTGSTLAFSTVRPIDDPRHGLTERYERALSTVQAALADLGIESTRTEPPNSFCPGQHSLASRGKIVGIAQRVTATTAAVSGIVIVRDHDDIAAVLDPIYRALDLPFDTASVSSVARAGGPRDVAVVADTLERHLGVTGRTPTVTFDDLRDQPHEADRR